METRHQRQFRRASPVLIASDQKQTYTARDWFLGCVFRVLAAAAAAVGAGFYVLPPRPSVRKQVVVPAASVLDASAQHTSGAGWRQHRVPTASKRRPKECRVLLQEKDLGMLPLGGRQHLIHQSGLFEELCTPPQNSRAKFSFEPGPGRPPPELVKNTKQPDCCLGCRRPSAEHYDPREQWLQHFRPLRNGAAPRAGGAKQAASSRSIARTHETSTTTRFFLRTQIAAALHFFGGRQAGRRARCLAGGRTAATRSVEPRVWCV